MSEEGYSTVMDAILFLALVCACAVILGPAVSGHMTEPSAADRGLRALAADALCSLETERVDYFEYRVLGDVVDRIAAAGSINASEDALFKDMAKALLGRGNRHRTVMDIAAGNAACQFLIRQGDVTLRLNPVTTDYDHAVAALVDSTVRSSLDSRYHYEFTLRWTPLAGIPLAGEIKSGLPCPAGAVSSSVQVSMPYTTSITRPVLEQVNEPDLEEIDRSLAQFSSDGDGTGLKQRLRTAIACCLKNTTAQMLEEIWANTLGGSASGNGTGNPVNVLKRFIDGDWPETPVVPGLNISLKDLADSLASTYYSAEAEDLAEGIARDFTDGRLGPDDAREMVLDSLKARYEPSSALATISLWTGTYV
ncbi:MAG: hypothetical protein ACM3PB_00135 [Betaproteobacteria bacterium]